MYQTYDDLPFIWVQTKNDRGTYSLVDNQTGNIIFENVCGWFCDMVFKLLDNEKVVYVRQFA